MITVGGYTVSASCDIFGNGVLRISEIFVVSVALESCGSTDLTNPVAMNSSWERFIDF